MTDASNIPVDPITPSDTPIEKVVTKDSDQVIKKSAMPKKTLMILGGVALIILLLILGLVIAFANKNKDKESEDLEPTPTPTIEVTPTVTTTPEPTVVAGKTDKNRILYEIGTNLWVMNSDGSSKKQITTDGNGSSVRYTDYDWKSAGIISYSKCSSSCKVYTKDLDTSVQTEVWSAPKFTQSIDTISWSPDGKVLGILFAKTDSSSEAILVNGTKEIKLRTYAPRPGRGVGYEDAIKMVFSTGGTYVIVHNTIVVEDPIIAVHKIDGTEVLLMEDGTSPVFGTDNKFYYKEGNSIKLKTIGTAGSETISTFAEDSTGYDLEVSPDGNFLSFWSTTTTGFAAFYHDLGGSSSLIANGYMEGQWLDNSKLVAIKANNSAEGMGYDSKGIAIVNRVGGTAKVIEPKAVYGFEVE